MLRDGAGRLQLRLEGMPRRPALQRHDAARFCVIGTSLYFACIANGNSCMYHSQVMTALAAKAGLKVVTLVQNLGVSHSLMELHAA